MKTLVAFAGAVLIAGSAHAGTPVHVEITGEVEFNQISAPPLGLMSSGDAVNISFMLDSEDFQDGALFPTRGYAIDQDSFSFSAGGAELGLQNPYSGVPYFILRDNDPAVDGFLFGSDPDVGFPDGIALDQTGIFGDFRSNYSTTYVGDTLDSLDIVDAAGTYGFDGLTVFGFGILDGGFDAAGFVFEQMTITVIPAPATLAALAPFAIGLRRRRRG